LNVQASSDWETPPFCPPIVNGVDRGDRGGFEPTVTNTVALPVPDSGETAAHDCALDALQAQLGAFVVTPIEPLPPADPNGPLNPEVSRVTLHARPSCAMCSVCPPTVSVPLRGVVVELG